MNPASSQVQTLSFVFDNENDQLLMVQLSADGPLKRKHSGIKGQIEMDEDTNAAAVRSLQESTGLEIGSVVLRGVVKTVNIDNQASGIWLVYETSRFSGELNGNVPGRLKWVDILNIFNLQMEGFVQELMSYLLDGESFFEGTVRITNNDEVVESDIRICNTI